VILLGLLLDLLRWSERGFSFLIGVFVRAEIILTLISMWSWILLFEVGLLELRLYVVLLVRCVVLIENWIDLSDW